MLIKRILKLFFKTDEAFYNDSIYEVIRFRHFTIILGIKRLASKMDKVFWQIKPYETPMLDYLKSREKAFSKFSWIDDVN